MANGTATTDKKLQFKPRKSSHEQQPDAPQGGWSGRILKGKCKVTVTQNGDPRLLIPIKLEKAMEEENENFQGAEVTFSATVFDDNDADKRRAANINKRELSALCTACGVDFSEVYPTEINSADDFTPLFKALEGQTLDLWTVHTTYTAQSGEAVNKTDIRFKKPGAGLVTKSADDDEDEDERPGKKKPAAKARR